MRSLALVESLRDGRLARLSTALMISLLLVHAAIVACASSDNVTLRQYRVNEGLQNESTCVVRFVPREQALSRQNHVNADQHRTSRTKVTRHSSPRQQELDIRQAATMSRHSTQRLPFQPPPQTSYSKSPPKDRPSREHTYKLYTGGSQSDDPVMSRFAETAHSSMATANSATLVYRARVPAGKSSNRALPPTFSAVPKKERKSSKDQSRRALPPVMSMPSSFPPPARGHSSHDLIYFDDDRDLDKIWATVALFENVIEHVDQLTWSPDMARRLDQYAKHLFSLAPDQIGPFLPLQPILAQLGLMFTHAVNAAANASSKKLRKVSRKARTVGDLFK